MRQPEHNFFEGDKETDHKVIENIIKDNFDAPGINVIPDKEIIFDEAEDEDENEYKNGDKSESWKFGSNSEDWKGDEEAGILRYVNKNENSILLFQILAEKYPILGVILKDGITDIQGKYRPEYIAVIIDNEKGMREVVKSMLDNPIIDLLCTSLGDRKLFDSNFERVASHGFLPVDILNKIKARYLYEEYEYEKENGFPEYIRTGEEITHWESTYLNNHDLKELFENVIDEELRGRGII